MLLRYFSTDYSTYKENELLFNGSVEDCKKYIQNNWSVDYLNQPKEVIDELLHHLKSIQYSNTNWIHNGKYSTIEELENASPICGVYDGPWHSINPQEFIYNECVIEVL